MLCWTVLNWSVGQTKRLIYDGLCGQPPWPSRERNSSGRRHGELLSGSHTLNILLKTNFCIPPYTRVYFARPRWVLCENATLIVSHIFLGILTSFSWKKPPFSEYWEKTSTLYLKIKVKQFRNYMPLKILEKRKEILHKFFGVTFMYKKLVHNYSFTWNIIKKITEH